MTAGCRGHIRVYIPEGAVVASEFYLSWLALALASLMVLSVGKIMENNFVEATFWRAWPCVYIKQLQQQILF